MLNESDAAKLTEAISRYQGYAYKPGEVVLNTFHFATQSLVALVLQGQISIEDLELIAIAATEIAGQHQSRKELTANGR